MFLSKVILHVCKEEGVEQGQVTLEWPCQNISSEYERHAWSVNLQKCRPVDELEAFQARWVNFINTAKIFAVRNEIESAMLLRQHLHLKLHIPERGATTSFYSTKIISNRAIKVSKDGPYSAPFYRQLHALWNDKPARVCVASLASSGKCGQLFMTDDMHNVVLPLS